MRKTRVFFAAFVLALAPMIAIAQNKGAPEPKKGDRVCVLVKSEELPPNSQEKIMVDIAKALGRPVTCYKCTSESQITHVCAMSCPQGGTC